MLNVFGIETENNPAFRRIGGQGRPPYGLRTGIGLFLRFAKRQFSRVGTGAYPLYVNTRY